MIKEFLECGKIVTTHGVKGEVKIQPWADSAKFLTEFKSFYLEEGKKELRVKASRVHKESLLALFEEVDTMDKAQLLRGKTLYIKRADACLPEGKYFWQDIIGMEAVDADNPEIIYGKLTDISETGANDVYHIENKDGREFLIPAIKDVIIKVDLEADRIFIRPLEGLFDDED